MKTWKVEASTQRYEIEIEGKVVQHSDFKKETKKTIFKKCIYFKMILGVLAFCLISSHVLRQVGSFQNPYQGRRWLYLMPLVALYDKRPYALFL